jgi:hypothetical protein
LKVSKVLNRRKTTKKSADWWSEIGIIDCARESTER